MADSTPKSYHTDPTLYLYTSLTSGSSHIISATSRMQTILKANRIEFQALDVATDEKARMLWGRRAGKRKLPGLVRFGMIVGDLEEVEEWNEYGELKENVNLPGPSKAAPVTPSPSTTNTPSKAPAPVESTPTSSTKATETTAAPSQPEPVDVDSEGAATSKAAVADTTAKDVPPASAESTLAMAMRQAGFEAAKKAGDAKTKARQEELERLRANTADAKKVEGSGSTEVSSPSEVKEDKEAKEPESGNSGIVSAPKNGELKEDGQETATPEAADKKDDGKVGEISDVTVSAAEAEMAKSAAVASEGAAEPDVLEGAGTAGPESGMSGEEEEKPAEKKETQHILNAKEAEEETNKAIIADEATHVHIAGSPPPFASPGMKHPKEDEETEDHPNPLNKPSIKEADHKEPASSTAEVESTEELAPEEGEVGKADQVEAKDESEDGQNNDKPITTSEPASGKTEPTATEGQPSTSPEAKPDIVEESTPAASKPTDEPQKGEEGRHEEEEESNKEQKEKIEDATEEKDGPKAEDEPNAEDEPKAEDNSEQGEKVVEEPKEDQQPQNESQEKTTDKSATEDDAHPSPTVPLTTTEHSSEHSYPEPASEPASTMTTATKDTITSSPPTDQAAPITPLTLTREPEPEPAAAAATEGTKTQAQPAASGERAEESVQD